LARSLEKLSRELAATVLQEANREAHAACESDSGGNWRWNFGIYVFSEQDAPRATPLPQGRIAQGSIAQEPIAKESEV
jgi:hypothetical protein